jgi:catalase
VAGWAPWQRSPRPAAFIDALEAREGRHQGHRRSHAKGACVRGYFEGASDAAALSTAALFQRERSQVIGRFALGGGVPMATDARVAPRSLSLRMRSPGGVELRTAMNHVPFAVVADPADFPALHLAHVVDPTTGAPDRQRVRRFFEDHPGARPFRDWLATAPLPSSFAAAAYHSAHAFELTDRSGRRRPARWTFEPDVTAEPLDRARLASLSPDFFFEDLRRRLASGPLRWTMIATLAGPGDDVNDPTAAWPASRARVALGRLTIEALDGSAACERTTFDPLILPPGIAPTADPVLRARSAAYAVGFERRAREGVSR